MGEDLPEEPIEYDPAVQYVIDYISYDDTGGIFCGGVPLGPFVSFRFGAAINAYFAAGGNCSDAILFPFPPGVKSQLLVDIRIF